MRKYFILALFVLIPIQAIALEPIEEKFLDRIRSAYESGDVNKVLALYYLQGSGEDAIEIITDREIESLSALDYSHISLDDVYFPEKTYFFIKGIRYTHNLKPLGTQSRWAI